MSAPKIIYLQYYGDDNSECEEPPPGVLLTWCEDKIFENDVCYIRYDEFEKIETMLGKGSQQIEELHLTIECLEVENEQLKEQIATAIKLFKLDDW